MYVAVSDVADVDVTSRAICWRYWSWGDNRWTTAAGPTATHFVASPSTCSEDVFLFHTWCTSTICCATFIHKFQYGTWRWQLPEMSFGPWRPVRHSRRRGKLAVVLSVINKMMSELSVLFIRTHSVLSSDDYHDVSENDQNDQSDVHVWFHWRRSNSDRKSVHF